MAPAGAKSTWLAIFFMCIPSGIALGYVTGGVLFSLTGSWRVPFVVEALLMVRPLPFSTPTAKTRSGAIINHTPRA